MLDCRTRKSPLHQYYDTIYIYYSNVSLRTKTRVFVGERESLLTRLPMRPQARDTLLYLRLISLIEKDGMTNK